MKTAIITDSNSGITRELGEQWGVRIVPMPIIIENETYYEGVDLFPEEFFRMLREGKSVSTSQPAPEDILRLWEEALSSGYDEVVYIPMTSGLSSSCQTALILAADFGGRVQVADNHQISVPLKTPSGMPWLWRRRDSPPRKSRPGWRRWAWTPSSISAWTHWST